RGDRHGWEQREDDGRPSRGHAGADGPRPSGPADAARAADEERTEPRPRDLEREEEGEDERGTVQEDRREDHDERADEARAEVEERRRERQLEEPARPDEPPEPFAHVREVARLRAVLDTGRRTGGHAEQKERRYGERGGVRGEPGDGPQTH